MRWRLAALIFAVLVFGVCWWFRPPAPFADPEEQPARFASNFTWERSEPWFGGFSGMELSEDGTSFHLIQDRGHLVQGAILRTNGKITDVTLHSHHLLQHDASENTKTRWSDSEGLAIGPDRHIHISFEGFHRVWFYTKPGAVAHWASYTEEWRQMINNGGLEALAIDRSNRLFTLPERPLERSTTVPVYSWKPGEKWNIPFHYPLRGRFRPVGADFGPDGRLYVLERDLFPFGFRSRVRALRISHTGISEDETILETPLGRHDNLEAISVWRDQSGGLRLTMISDDNFMWFQKTELVEYIVTE